jgi:hypothetical protein
MVDILVAMLPVIIDTAFTLFLGWCALWIYDGIVEMGEGE